MITFEKIDELNKKITKVDIKGKNYAMVAARVQAFRELCPDGAIETEIISLQDGVATMKATVRDESGKILATGHAQEKESSSFINKTSYIENCETSAVGRALGILGIGSDEQMASAEEVANAINNQGKKSRKDTPEDMAKNATLMDEVGNMTISTIKMEIVTNKAKEAGVPMEKVLEKFGLDSIGSMTEAQFADAIAMLQKQIDITKKGAK